MQGRIQTLGSLFAFVTCYAGMELPNAVAESPPVIAVESKDVEGRLHGKCAVSKAGNVIATMGADGIQTWTVPTRKDGEGEKIVIQRKDLLKLRFFYNHHMTMSLDGKLLAGADNRYIRVWDIENGNKVLGTFQGGLIRSIVISPDNQLLAVGDGGGSIDIWEIKTKEKRFVLTGHKGNAYSLAFTGDGKELVSAGDDSTVRIWDLQTGEMKGSIVAHTAEAIAVAVSPDNRFAASVGWDGTLAVSDLAKGKVKLKVDTTQKYMQCVCYSPGGKWIVTGGGLEIAIWDATTLKRLASWRPPLGSPGTLHLFADRKILISSGARSGTTFWDLSKVTR